MAQDRESGWMLIGGTLASLVTMAMHPNVRQMLDDFATHGPRNVVAHGLALLAIPFTLVGYGALARRLATRHAASARLGYACVAIASGAVAVAAIASGLLSTMLVARLVRLDGSEEAFARALLGYTGLVNQAFATVFVAGWSLAMLVWSLAVLRGAALARWLGWYGLLLGGVLLVVTLLGRLRLDVHHFGLIVVAQGVWTIGAGVELVRSRARPHA